MYNFKMKNKIGILFASLLLSFVFTTNTFAANIGFSIDGIVVTSTTAVINGKIISSDFTQTLPHIYLYVGTINETNIKTVSHIKGQLDQNTLNQPQNNALQFNELVQNLTPNTQYKYLISSSAGTNTSTIANSITEETGTFQTTASGTAVTETVAPTVYTKPVINILGSAATLTGQAQNNYQPIEFRFKYGTISSNLDDSTSFFPQHNSTSTFFGITESFQKEITTYHGQPLIDGTMYYYIACAKNTFGEACDTAHVESFAPKKNQTVLTPNTSGTESGKWWFKQAKDSEAKGPFSSIAECEIERAKGDSYSKQCFQFYYPLAPLPGQADKIDTSSGDSDCPFGNYLNILIKLFIGICAVLAMIKIVLGGMQYMTSELSSGKEDGKNNITSAVFGLILALGAFAILNTINPELLKVCLNNLPKAVVQIDIGGDSNVPFNPIQKTDLQTLGINCSETLAPTLSEQLTQLVAVSNSFLNKTTYSQTKRGTYDASKPTAYLDCSSFVNQVYKCVGKNSPGNWTGTIFNGGEDVTSISGTTVNNTQLKTGDLLGWKPGESKKYKGGHVFMYFGNNNIIEAHGPQEVINKSVEIKPLSYYQSEIKHIKRLQ